MLLENLRLSNNVQSLTPEDQPRQKCETVSPTHNFFVVVIVGAAALDVDVVLYALQLPLMLLRFRGRLYTLSLNGGCFA